MVICPEELGHVPHLEWFKSPSRGLHCPTAAVLACLCERLKGFNRDSAMTVDSEDFIRVTVGH